MKIECIDISNFKSFAANTTRVDFNQGLTLIRGVNGSGKTSIAEALLWCLWGRCHYKKASIPNVYTGGEVSVTVYMEDDNGVKYTVTRSTQNGVKVTKNGVIISFATIDDTNTYIESKLGISYQEALLTVILSGDMNMTTLTPANRKLLIEQVIGFSLLKDVSARAKSLYNTASNEVACLDSKISTLSKVMSTVQSYSEDEVAEMRSSLDEYKSSIQEAESSYNSLIDKMNSVKDERDKQYSSSQDIMTKGKSAAQRRDALSEEIKSLSQESRCPTCGSLLNSEHAGELIERYRIEIEGLTSQLESLRLSWKELSKSIADADSTLSELSKEADNIKQQSTITRNAITDISSKLSVIDSSSSTMSSIKSQIADAENEKADKVDEQDIALKVHKATNPAGSILNKVLLSNLKRISAIASEIAGFPITIDTQYDIKAFDRMLQVSNLSAGERGKVDLAIRLAMRAIQGVSDKGLDICFLDECMANIDLEAASSIITKLKEYATSSKLKMLIVHHAPLESYLFDHILDISKPSMFTQITHTK